MIKKDMRSYQIPFTPPVTHRTAVMNLGPHYRGANGYNEQREMQGSYANSQGNLCAYSTCERADAFVGLPVMRNIIHVVHAVSMDNMMT